MAMPGGGGMGPMPPQQQSMMSPHQQQMVAQQHQQAAVAAAAAAAAAAAQQAQQGHPIMQSGIGGPGGGPPPGGLQGGPGSHPPSQGPPGGPGSNQPAPNQPGPPSQGGPSGGGPPPQQQQEQARVDNISKAKALIPNLKESMLNVMRNAAMAINSNNMIDSGTKQVDYDVSRFDKSFEEFFSLVDQLEVHLRTSIECLNQSSHSSKYLPVPVTPSKTDSSMTYPQYIDLVKGQIAYAKEIHGALTEASQRLSE